MSNCECYTKDYDGLGCFIPRCNGTKEREGCQCGGDESKCDFYPEKREKASFKTMDALEYLQQRIRMCAYNRTSEHGACENCPFNQVLDKLDACDEFEEQYPEKAVQLVHEWALTHPKLPTWNDWLHNIYNYYKGFKSNHETISFLEWLNTPILLEDAERFNIPTRKELT